MSEPLLKAGAILSGRWQIQEFLGSGETGEVYGVRDMHSTQTFALKAFWPSALSKPELWSALQQAARAAASLGTESVARAQDFGIDANSGRPFAVAERVAFPSLGARVRQRGPLTPAEVATALDVSARTLDAAHLTGLVHRDLKPENVFIAVENASWVRITDFGVTLLRNASPPPPGWGGTPGWLGPDAGDPNARATPAMDIYSLGLVAFFALTGAPIQRALRASPLDFNALWQDMCSPLDSAAQRARELGVSVDPKFDVWFRRVLAPDPNMRFTSVAQMASAFMNIASSLVAPESASAVAIPGIAAAIAQPLVFQPETLPPTAAPRAAAGAGAGGPAPLIMNAPASAEPLASSPSGELPGVRKRSAAPLFIAGAVLCFGLTAAGAWALHRNHEAEAAAAAAASAAPSATAAAVASVVASVEPAASAVPNDKANIQFQCQPEACDWVVCDGEKLNGFDAGPLAIAAGEHTCSASKFGFNSKSVKFTAKAGVAQTIDFALTALPPGIQKLAGATAPAKPTTSAAAPPTAKAPATTPSKPAAAAPAAPKKKCGSVFIPCKG
ncbi:MAG TPA: protein kinase [Polyangiaceae bacterium]